MFTLKLVTASGSNATMIGEVYGEYDGVTWRDAVDNCDVGGSGRVFLECDDQDTVDFVEMELQHDERILEWRRTMSSNHELTIDDECNVCLNGVSVEFVGWAGPDIDGNECDYYHIADYFDSDGRYRGPDQHGTYPVFM